MEKFRIYGERSAEPSTLELQNRKLAKLAASEGIVLLKNDGTLPLTNKHVSLFGAGARLTYKGGLGSGNVNERYSVNIEDGLKNNGFTIINPTWLNRFSKTYDEKQTAHKAEIEAAIKHYKPWNVMAMFQKIHEFKFVPPVGDEININDLSTETDTAIYIISRQAGEGFDRTVTEGDYLLSNLEITNIKVCVEHYKNVIVVINSGGPIDLTPLEDVKISALLYFGQAGQEGGNALAEIIAGKTNPSGKLTSTWAHDYYDYPAAEFFVNPPVKYEEDYIEDIYVGYRYFQANNKDVRFPFGYGLSYTTFAHEVVNIKVIDTKVTITVKVTNKGKKHSGQQVIQCYLKKPNNKYNSEPFALVAFEKTTSLAPQKHEEITLEFDLIENAVYDMERASFMLEAEKYGVFIGTDANAQKPVALLKLAKDSVVEQCETRCGLKKHLSLFIPKKETYKYPEDLSVFDLAFKKSIKHNYKFEMPKASVKTERLLETLTDKELAMFAMGGGYFTKTFNKVPGACGNTTSRLLKKGIPNIMMVDGPAGLNVLQKVAFTKHGGVRYIDELPEQWQWGWLRKFVPKLKFLFAKEKHTPVYQYATAWPIATVLAQTWNTKLLKQVGHGIGQEMQRIGATLWLAPALNIHRNPLCGRNFEYFSEDPYVSGIVTGAITDGVQQNEGVGVVIKHFAANNRENDRTLTSSNVSERALREIYLKGFKLALKSKPAAIMSSYNKINGEYAVNSYELLTDILRHEWKYEGLVMSDWNATDQCSHVKAIKAGNNMIMPGNKHVYKKIVTALKKGELTRDDVLVSATYALNLINKAATSYNF